MQTYDPLELGIGSVPNLNSVHSNNNSSIAEDNEYSFHSDFVNHFNPDTSPALTSDSRKTPLNQVFSFDSPYISSDPFRDTFDIGISKSMVPTDTVIIQDYSNLFSFNKLFAINSKISPSVEACIHNAKLSKVLGLPKSVQRAWKISQVICSDERRKKI